MSTRFSSKKLNAEAAIRMKRKHPGWTTNTYSFLRFPKAKTDAEKYAMAVRSTKFPTNITVGITDLVEQVIDAYDLGIQKACEDFALLVAQDATKPKRIQLNADGTWRALK